VIYPPGQAGVEGLKVGLHTLRLLQVSGHPQPAAHAAVAAAVDVLPAIVTCSTPRGGGGGDQPVHVALTSEGQRGAIVGLAAALDWWVWWQCPSGLVDDCGR
jgi:hypothetical protein